MRIAVLVVFQAALVSMLAIPGAVFAQDFQQIPAPIQPSYAFYSNPYPSAQNKLWDDRALQRELELTREQRRKLIEIKIDFEDAVAELRQQLKEIQANRYTYNSNGTVTWNKDVQQQTQDLQKQIRKVTEAHSKLAEDVLLPHQVDIRQQVRFEKSIAQGFIQQLSSGQLNRFLDLSQDQRKRITEKKQKLDQRMKESIARMMVELKDELLRELDPEQRRTAREILENYEYRADGRSLSPLQYERTYMKKKKR